MATLSHSRRNSRQHDAGVEVISVATGVVLQRLRVGERPVEPPAVSIDSSGRVAVAADALQLWIPTLESWTVLEGHSAPVGHAAKVVCISRDGSRVVAAIAGQCLRVWGVATNSALTDLERGEGEVAGCSASDDGRVVVSGSFARDRRAVSGRHAEGDARDARPARGVRAAHRPRCRVRERAYPSESLLAMVGVAVNCASVCGRVAPLPVQT